MSEREYPDALPHGQVRGRGAGVNPVNRYDGLSLHVLGEHLDEQHREHPDGKQVQTRVVPDDSRRIINHVDSPDLPFRWTINPYRGCEHACSYCVAGDTRVLMGNGTERRMEAIRVGDEIYGTIRRGAYRRFVRTRVRAHWMTQKPAFRIWLENGVCLTASGDHRFLTERGWKHVTGAEQGLARRPHLTKGIKLLGIGQPFNATVQNADYKRGYLCGMIRGDGHLATCDPAILREREINGYALESSVDLRVADIEPLNGVHDLFDITTGTGDFFANGVVSHNCYARPTHEQLGYSCGLDFETIIHAKHDAPELLRRELAHPRWAAEHIVMSGVTDPYQPLESKLEITRGCLTIMAECGQPVSMVTKNRMITRDVDLLSTLADQSAAMAAISLTSLDPKLSGLMEPRASSPRDRLEAIRTLSDAGVPVQVLLAPIIPGLNEQEIPKLLEAAAEAGASHANWILLRLPYQVKDVFFEWAERHFPDRVDRLRNTICDTRGGVLYKSTFGRRHRGEGPFAIQIKQTFDVFATRLGLNQQPRELSSAAFRRPALDGQMDLFS